jgi:hypothetical protein
MDALDQIFKKYANKNIILKWSDKDFSNLVDDLYEYFQSEDDVTEFMATLADEYAQKYNIDFVEPEEFPIDIQFQPEPETPGRAPQDGPKPGPAFEEKKRMMELAGLFEDEDDATRYALMLEDQEETEMDVVEVDPDLAIRTCRLYKYKYAIITPNDIVIPPKNVSISQD